MDLSVNLTAFILVVGGRLGLPLLIPRFPLIGVVLCMLLDSADQTIFQRFTTIDLAGYQSYDKALDIYYLSIAYISTLRNWTNMFAFKASKFLLYYRLVGVTLFELTGFRAILLILPNTFEYFFIFYQAIALRWNPLRYPKRLIIGSIVFIWIFIKLPQEWWIHIAKLDVTETLNKYLFHLPINTPMSQAFLSHMGISLAILAVVIGIIFLARWYIINKLPPANVKLLFAIKAPNNKDVRETASSYPPASFFRGPLFEKIVLIGLVSTIFAMMLPSVKASLVSVFVFVALVITVNSWISHQMSKNNKDLWTFGVFREFLSMISINFAILILFLAFLPNINGSEINWQITSFFLLLITIFITLYDRYFPVHQFLSMQKGITSKK